MNICAYVLQKNAKQNYKKESFDVRLNAGLMVVIDILKRAGYEVEFAGKSTVHKYDVVLFSITSDCDWWPFIAERSKWQKGNYKVVVGGQGVLNVRPFLNWIDYFVLGRAEGVIDSMIQCLNKQKDFENKHVVNAKTFNVDKEYYINQVTEIYPHDINLENGATYHEDVIGCNHKCLFCGYTWQRKQAKQEEFNYSGLWNGGKDRERAMIDMENGIDIDLVKLRTTAIDGLSQRLRYGINKRINREMIQRFLVRLASCEKPHQVKFYNIIGYPTETHKDWFEFLEDIAIADSSFKKQDKQTSILLHSTPFRAMPATPLACSPMSYRNYRGEIGRLLGKGLKGNIFYQGNAMWAVESMATESLSTVTMSAIILRGEESDADNIVKIATSPKFFSSSSKIKTATLEKYFDVAKLFGAYDPKELPTKYLRTYCKIKYKVYD